MRLSALLMLVASVPIYAQQRSTGIPLIVTNTPFTAQQSTTSSFPQPDGTTATVIRRIDMARDSSGSTRAELRILSNSPADTEPVGTASVDIQNLASRQAIHLDPSTNTATVQSIRQTKRLLTLPVVFPGDAVPSGQSQDLGNKIVEGFAVRGTRQILQLAGTNGQNPAIQTVDTWYSPDLKINLVVQKSDTLGNSSTTNVTSIVSGEPSAALFLIPSTYTIRMIGPSTATAGR